MVYAALRALTRHLVVLAQDRRQLQLLEVVPEENLGRAGPGAARHGAVNRGGHAAISSTSSISSSLLRRSRHRENAGYLVEWTSTSTGNLSFVSGSAR